MTAPLAPDTPLREELPDVLDDVVAALLESRRTAG